MARWSEQDDADQLGYERRDGAEGDTDAVPDRPFAPGRRTRTMSILRLQRAPDDAAPSAPAASPAAGAAGPAPADAMIVEDGTANQPGQLQRTQFLSQLHAQVIAAANDALGPIWSATGCPYIEQWFAQHASTPARELEQLARRYSGVAAPAAATDYFPPIVARLRGGIARWRAGDSITGDTAAAGLGITSVPPATPAAGGAIQRKSDGTQAAEVGSPAAILGEIGQGSALDARDRQRLGAAMGDGFTDVRIHTDQTAAHKAAELGARAFTIGTHVAFAAGQFRPGTPEGDGLLAHELAHVQQQRGGALDAAARKKSEIEGPDGPLEQEADQVAAAAVAQLHQPGAPARAKPPKAKSSLTSQLSLKRCNSSSTPAPAPTPPAPAPAPPIPTGHGPDSHAGAALPDADQQAWLAGELNPERVASHSGPTPTIAPWDGLAANPHSAQNQAALTTQMTTAIRNFLNGRMAGLHRLATTPRVPMSQAGTGAMAGQDTGVEGIAAQANEAVSQSFGGDTAGAALSTSQSTQMTSPLQATGPSRTLFDQNNLADLRTGMNMNDDGLARDAAQWIGTSTPAAKGVLAAHHLSTDAPGEQQTFWDNFLDHFLAQGSNRADCLLFQQFGLDTTTDRGVLLSTATDPQAFGGDVNRAMRSRRWSLFMETIHETVHRRAHPAFNSARTGQVMREGFCELFAEVVGNRVLPLLRSGGAEPMRNGIEGQVQPIDPTMIPAVYRISSTYQDFYDHAKRIRDGGGGHTGIGDGSCRAAYFQGHVELLGLNPDGTPAAAAPAGSQTLPIPAGIHTVDELATASGVPRGQLVTDNPGIDSAFPAQAKLAGCRIHVVVSSGAAVEDRAMIAAQNGVSEADLARANPGIPLDAATNNWPALTAGATILIPVH